METGKYVATLIIMQPYILRCVIQLKITNLKYPLLLIKPLQFGAYLGDSTCVQIMWMY